MTKKAKQKLEKELSKHVQNKYYDQIKSVEVIDKHSCKITIESMVTPKSFDITLPIASLGYQVQGAK